jgi:hypothetical protein
MSDRNDGKKIVAVSNGLERETYFLEKILRGSGRKGLVAVVPTDEAAGKGRKASVLLTKEPPECPQQELFPVCVTKFLPEHRKPEGLRKIVTYSSEWDGADFTARNIRTLPGGVTAFEIVGIGIIGRVRLERGCEEDVEAALAAAAAATEAGVPFAEALGALNAPEKA